MVSGRFVLTLLLTRDAQTTRTEMGSLLSQLYWVYLYVSDDDEGLHHHLLSWRNHCHHFTPVNKYQLRPARRSGTYRSNLHHKTQGCFSMPRPKRKLAMTMVLITVRRHIEQVRMFWDIGTPLFLALQEEQISNRSGVRTANPWLDDDLDISWRYLRGARGVYMRFEDLRINLARVSILSHIRFYTCSYISCDVELLDNQEAE